MDWIYGIVTALSLLLAVGYCWRVKKKERWFLLLFASVFVANLGYFLMSVSATLQGALTANRISYLGSVFLPLAMLVIIMHVCDLRIKPVVLGVLVTISILVFLLAASGGYLQLYYKEVYVEYAQGVAVLKKVYGPLHGLYYIYLLSYFCAMVGVILYSVFQNRAVPSKYAAVLVVLVLWNIAIWFVEQLIDWNFEFLSVSYMVTELLLLFLHSMVREYDILGGPSVAEAPPALPLDKLTAREAEVLELLLEKKTRKEIAEALFVTENTIKKHTAHIYEKLGVANRTELLIKMGRS